MKQSNSNITSLIQVAATNLPVHNIPAEAVASVAEVPETESEPVVVDAYKGDEVMTPQVQYSYLPYAQNYEYYGAASNPAPVPVVETTYSNSPPVIASVPATPVVQATVPVVQAVSTDGAQYHSQDDLGKSSNQINFLL